MAENVYNTAPLINVRNLNIFKLETDTKETTTYGTGEYLAETISLTMTPQVASGELFGDGYQTDSHDATVSVDIALNIRGLDPKQQAKMLNYETDANGMVIVTGSPKPVYWGATFEAERSDGSWEYFVIYKLKFAPIGKEFGTKSSSIDYKTPNVTGKSLAIKKPSPKGDVMFYGHLLGDETNTAVTSLWHDTPQFLALGTGD